MKGHHGLPISEFGGYVPDRVLTSQEWASTVDTFDEWITTRTSIHERLIAADDQSTVDLAEVAAPGPLPMPGLTPRDVDEIIVATDTPEVVRPDTAALLQHRLGARHVPAYDLAGSGCAGFLQALDVARTRVQMSPRLIVVIGAELIMRIISWEDRVPHR